MANYRVRFEHRSREFLLDLHNKIIEKFPDVEVDELDLYVHGEQGLIEVLEFIKLQKPEYPDEIISLQITDSLGVTYYVERETDLENLIEMFNKKKY